MASPRSTISGQTFLYEGDCAFCTSCVRFAERHIPTGATFLPWQFADLDAMGVTQEQVREAVQWVDTDGTVTGGVRAIARLLVDAGSYWRLLGRVLASRPVLWLARPVYRWVARNRHRMPGGTAACALPPSRP